MGYRDLGNIDEKIILTILKMGAENGVQKVSSKKIALQCGISTYTIFEHFGTMRNALDEAAKYFDRIHMAQVTEMANSNKTVEEIWDCMLDEFIADPDGSLYYTSYTNVFGFDPTSNNPRATEFLEIACGFFGNDLGLSDDEYLILWDYITSMAFYYAEKFIHKYMKYDEPTKAYVKRVVFEGISSIASNTKLRK